jgi:rRNA maturation endonuclease Nob1
MMIGDSIISKKYLVRKEELKNKDIEVTFCYYCGNKLNETAICPSCGEKVDL